MMRQKGFVLSGTKGFTLVELLIVITIMVVLGVIFTDILIESLRGQNKVRIVNQVKQNGQVVLEKISNEIRQADEVVCPEGGGSSDTIMVYSTTANMNEWSFEGSAGGWINKGSKNPYTRFKYHQPNSMQNGYISIDHPLMTGGLECDASASDLTNVSDTDPVNGISVYPESTGSSIFTVSYTPGYKKKVGISFKARAGVNVGYAYEVTVAEGGVPFSTTVQLRGGKN